MEQALHDYIKSGDYSHPFVIIGWTRVGKTSLVDEVLNEHGLYERCLLYNSPSEFGKVAKQFDHLKSIRFISLSERDAKNDGKDFLEFLSQGGDKPIIVEQSYENEDFLKMFEQSPSIVYVLDFDKEQWLKSLTGSHKVVEFLEQQPLEMIHVGYLDDRSRMCCFPDPSKWDTISEAFGVLDSEIRQLGYARNSFLEFLEEYVNRQKKS